MRSFQDWLLFIQSLHTKEMDLGLERVAAVAKRLHVSPNAKVITVAGTNGKGSCVAGLEAIYLAAGYRVGAFTSPFLWKYNEQVRLLGGAATDDAFCQAFENVEAARGDIALTMFEFNTLAALVMFQEAALHVWILEVGLGGRFDAVNIIDADVAVVSSIDLDHVEWLGDTREKIAFEKAGIFRSGKPAVCGDLKVPQTLIDVANKINAPLYCLGKEFTFSQNNVVWNWQSENQRLDNLFLPSLHLQNMASVLMVVELLQKALPVSSDAIFKALEKVTLPGRIQVVPGEVTQIFDVSHNPAAAALLAAWLNKNKIAGKTRAVFSMLADKDMVGTLDVIKNKIDAWFIAPLSIKRGATLDVLIQNFKTAEIVEVEHFGSTEEAYQAALAASKSNDRVVVFGSFYVVSKTRNPRA